MPKLKKHQRLFVASMGKFLRVTAIFPSDDDANKYTESHRDEGVVACFGSIVLVASLHDHGTEFKEAAKAAQ